MSRGLRRLSLRSQLLLGILLPVLALISINTVSLYRQSLHNANMAYDRTLLASAKVIGEQLEVHGNGDVATLRATVPYSALEAFDADNRSRMFYKVSGFAGEMVSGFEDLPAWRGKIPAQGIYSALVDFYDDHYLGQPVRVAVLLQPVAGAGGRGMATIQVAETLELRRTLARQVLLDTLWRQAALLAVIALVVVGVVQFATRPVRELSATLRRLQLRAQHRQRRAQLVRGVAPAQALDEMSDTVDRATMLANQMLALAKVEQLRQQGDATVVDWADAVRAVALDLAPLIAMQQLDFELDTKPAPVRAHDWALRELTRNLMHNAVKHTAAHGRLGVRLVTDERRAVLHVVDSGPGIAPELRRRLFQPFAAGDPRSGSGLGLAICHEIVLTLDGEIRLDNRLEQGRVVGLDAVVMLALADNRAP